MAVALLVAVVGSKTPEVWADPKGFVFTPLVFLGDPTPGGDTFLDLFQANISNNHGAVLCSANATIQP